MPLVKVVILINQKVSSLILYSANRGLSLKKKEGTEIRSFICICMCYLYSTIHLNALSMYYRLLSFQQLIKCYNLAAIIHMSLKVNTSLLPDYHDNVKIWHINKHSQQQQQKQLQQQILIIFRESRKLVSYSYQSSALTGSTGTRKLHKIKGILFQRTAYLP